MNEIFDAPTGEHIEEFVDDVDGSRALHTVRIGWAKEWREIHLSDTNFAALATEFERFWNAARPVAAGRTARTPRARRQGTARSSSRGEIPHDE